MVRALDQITGMGIPQSVLVIPEQGRREISDASGWVQVEVFEEGIYEGLLSANGYTTRRIRIEVLPDAPSYRQEIFLSPIVLDLEAFKVEAELTAEDRNTLAERDAIAPMNQISGEALRDITDDGLGDSLEKISGVTVSTDEGSVSGVSIRGAGARQTRITMDGQSMAGGGGRGTTRGGRAMGQIPQEFLTRVQVMKAPTPDMDADAIGGTVDLQTSRVAKSKQARSSLAIRSSYQEEGETWGQRVNLAHAQPIQLRHETQRLGILIAANANKNEASQDDLRILNQWPFRASPETGDRVRMLARLRIGSRDISNEGSGVILNSDLQLNKNNTLLMKALFNERRLSISSQLHSIEFIRGSISSLTPLSGEFEKIGLEKQFLKKQQKDESGSFVLGGEHKLGKWMIEESIGYSFATTESRGAQNGTFRTGRIYDGGYDLSLNPARPNIHLAQDGAPLTAEDLLNPETYLPNRYDLIDDWAEDAELALRLNLTRRWESDKAEWILKGGFKGRLRDADQDQDRLKHIATPSSFTLEDVASNGTARVFKNKYPIGPAWSAESMQTLFEEHPDFFIYDPLSKNLDSVASDFSVSESIYATYGMIQRESDKWIFIAGLRLERTDSQAKGFETVLQKDENGERFAEARPVSISDRYDKLFPGFHVLYRPNQKWILRGSVTRTLQRPDFRDLSPSSRVNLDTRRIRSGNPDLEPFDAKAVDIGTDVVLNGWASASFGIFYKRIDDFIVDIEEETQYLGEPDFIRSYPVNGSPADLLGIEAAWNTRLAFLPAPFEETNLSVNYTLTDSTADYPGFQDTVIMLPEQVRETLNLSLRWQYQNWTVNLRTRYRGLQLNDLIEPGQDQFSAGFWSHSISLNYKLNDTVTFSLGLANLNQPDRVRYQGNPNQPIATREGSRSLNIGLNVKFGAGQIRIPGKQPSEADKEL